MVGVVPAVTPASIGAVVSVVAVVSSVVVMPDVGVEDELSLLGEHEMMVKLIQ